MILIIEDDKFAKSVMMETLANDGFDIVGHANMGKEGIEMANEYDPDIITLDYMLPDMTGKEILEKIKRSKSHAKVILISAINDPIILNECKSLGIFEHLTKPVDPNTLKTVVKKAYASLKEEMSIVKFNSD